MDRNEAIDCIEDGHAIYLQDVADEICEALGMALIKGHPFYSQPNIFKGVMMEEGYEGAIAVSSLTLGSVACRRYGLKPRECFGRGSQGRIYAQTLREYFDKEAK